MLATLHFLSLFLAFVFHHSTCGELMACIFCWKLTGWSVGHALIKIAFWVKTRLCFPSICSWGFKVEIETQHKNKYANMSTYIIQNKGKNTINVTISTTSSFYRHGKNQPPPSRNCCIQHFSY